MADITRECELFDLVPSKLAATGGVREADLGRLAVRTRCYVDTGAGRTVMSERLARRVRVLDLPGKTFDYTVPIKVRARAVLCAVRLREDGCTKPVAVMCAVSDEVIGALDLGGLEILVGQDFLQLSRVRLDLRPGGAHSVSCREE